MMDVADMDALQAAMETPGAAAAMDHDGVIPESLVILSAEARQASRMAAGLILEFDGIGLAEYEAVNAALGMDFETGGGDLARRAALPLGRRQARRMGRLRGVGRRRRRRAPS